MSAFTEALVAFEYGDFSRAAELFGAAAEQGENSALALSKRGVCRLRLGNRAGAERDFRSALEIDRRCVPAIVNLGNMAQEAGELDVAQGHYLRALQIDETYSFAHYNLGVLYRKKGDVAASVRELRLAAKYDAKPTQARKRLDFWRRR